MASPQATPANAAPTLRIREFQQFRELAYRHFGLDFHSGKHALVASRLGKVMRGLGLRSFRDYYDHINSDPSGAALANMADQLTTNHTSFFREPAHFDYLRKTIFPRLRHRSHIHIWSTACSTGEEPCSIALSLLDESPREAAAKVRIKASDISTTALAKARSGTYAKDHLTPVSAPMQERYLVSAGSSSTLRFNDVVRSMIHFERLNLMDPFPAGYRCSLIFCRNVMIYFDRPTRHTLVHQLTQQLEPGGYLFIGHAETLNNIDHGLKYLRPSIYIKPASTNRDPNGGA